MRRLGDFLFRYPRAVLVLLVLIVLSAVYPAWQIRTDFNLEGFYPQDDQVLTDYRLLEDEFGRDDNTILIGFQTDELFNREVLLDLKSMTDRLGELPHIRTVQSLWNAHRMTNVDDRLEFEPYLDTDRINRVKSNKNTYAPDENRDVKPYPGSQIDEYLRDRYDQNDSHQEPGEQGEVQNNPDADLSSLRSDLLDDPFVSGFLVNPEGTATAIAIEIDDEENAYEVRNRVINGMEVILADYPYDFKISGIPYYRNQYVNLLNDEILIYIIISSLLIITLLFMLYRSALGILLPILIVWATLLLTIALMQLTGGYLEIMSSTIAPILLCVGVADAVHMISKYDDARDTGLDKRNGIKEMLITLGSATFLTSITTAIGFASLSSSSVVPMQRFGIYTALGVLVAYLITIIFLPAALRLSSRKKVFNENKTRIYPVIGRFLEKVSVLNRMHHRSVIGITVVMILVFAAGMIHLKVDGRVFDDIREDSRLIQDSRFFSDNLAPPFPMEIILDTGMEEGIFDPHFIARQARFEEFLSGYGEVERTISTHTLLKQVHRTLNPGSETTYPGSASQAAQYVLLLEMNDADELGRLADFHYQIARFTILMQDAGSTRINEIRDDIEEWLATEFSTEDALSTDRHNTDRITSERTKPVNITTNQTHSGAPVMNTGSVITDSGAAVTNSGPVVTNSRSASSTAGERYASGRPVTEYTITGTTILSADLTEKIVYSIFWSILLAVTAISLVMAYMFRSPLLVFISMVPNLVPLVMVAGILGWFGLDIKPSTAVIFTVALGIAVDDSIHYLARFRIEYIRNGNMSLSLHRTTVKTGRAIIITSLIIMAGFGSLLTSDFTSTALMGLLVGITIFSALIADLLLLPSLFYWLKPKLNLRKDGFEPPGQADREFHRETEMHPA